MRTNLAQADVFPSVPTTAGAKLHHTRNFLHLHVISGCYSEKTSSLAKPKVKFQNNRMEGNHLTNKLAYFRTRMKFSQKQIAAILGLKNVGTLSHYERGSARPSLERALALGIVYRVPVEFLFPDLYDQLKARIRQKEDRLSSITKQRSLPLGY